jgi:hypothetical protein
VGWILVSKLRDVDEAAAQALGHLGAAAIARGGRRLPEHHAHEPDRDRSALDAQRQICKAENELPILAQQPLMGRVYELGRRRGRRYQPVRDRGESPLDVRMEARSGAPPAR